MRFIKLTSNCDSFSYTVNKDNVYFNWEHPLELKNVRSVGISSFQASNIQQVVDDGYFKNVSLTCNLIERTNGNQNREVTKMLFHPLEFYLNWTNANGNVKSMNHCFLVLRKLVYLV